MRSLLSRFSKDQSVAQFRDSLIPPINRGEGKLQNKLRQVRVLRQVAHVLLHVSLVNRHRFAGAVRGRVADVIEHPFQHRMQPPRPDVLDGGVDLGGDIRNGYNAFLGEVKVNSLGSQQRLVLLD